MKNLLAVILVLAAACFFGAGSALAQQDAYGWVDGSNTWDQWQNVNFSPNWSGGYIDGSSQQAMEMWGGAGAGIGDPASYTSQLVLGQSVEVSHLIPGGKVNYKLDEIQAGYIDLTANPGETKGISVGGENNTSADIYTSASSWNNVPAKCGNPANAGGTMSSGGSADLSMNGWVSGVQPGDTGEYHSAVFQQIGAEQAQNIPGGTMLSYSSSVQLGTIDIELAP